MILSPTEEPQMEITQETKLSEILESQTCGRCGGSGHYSFNQIHGSMCYGCGGTGAKLTKRGVAARELYRSLLTVPAEAVKVGDRIHVDGNGITHGSGWATVQEVEVDELGGLRGGGEILSVTDRRVAVAREANKIIEPYEQGRVIAREQGPRVSIRTKRVSQRGLLASSPIKVGGVDPAVRVAILKSVAEYQESLTKTGKPRKDSRFAPVAA